MRKLLTTLLNRDTLSPSLLLLRAQGAWLSFRFYWSARDDGHLLLGTFLFLIIISAIGSIYYATIKSSETRDLNCLAMNIYQEARGEPLAGQFAVARVTLNRVNSPRFPSTICEVVYEKRWDRLRKRYVGAFSWTELPMPEKLDSKTWDKAWRVAKQVYASHKPTDLKGAMFYHATRIRPSWARKKIRVAKIGRHIFYK